MSDAGTNSKNPKEAQKAQVKADKASKRREVAARQAQYCV